MFGKKTLSEVTLEDIVKYREVRSKMKNPNNRTIGKDEIMGILNRGARAIPRALIKLKKKNN